jgi:hypothetical protein
MKTPKPDPHRTRRTDRLTFILAAALLLAAGFAIEKTLSDGRYVEAIAPIGIAATTVVCLIRREFPLAVLFAMVALNPLVDTVVYFTGGDYLFGVSTLAFTSLILLIAATQIVRVKRWLGLPGLPAADEREAARLDEAFGLAFFVTYIANLGAYSVTGGRGHVVVATIGIVSWAVFYFGRVWWEHRQTRREEPAEPVDA